MPLNNVERSERAFDPVPHGCSDVKITGLDSVQHSPEVLGQCRDLGVGHAFGMSVILHPRLPHGLISQSATSLVLLQRAAEIALPQCFQFSVHSVEHVRHAVVSCKA